MKNLLTAIKQATAVEWNAEKRGFLARFDPAGHRIFVRAYFDRTLAARIQIHVNDSLHADIGFPSIKGPGPHPAVTADEIKDLFDFLNAKQHITEENDRKTDAELATAAINEILKEN